MDDPKIFRPRRSYRLFVLAGLAVAFVFVWELSRGFTLPALFFLLTTLGVVAVYTRWALMRLELTPDGLTVHGPMQPPQHIRFRQMVACVEAGRLTQGLSLVYLAAEESGFVNPDRPRSLFLPAVERQDELRSALEQHMPG